MTTNNAITADEMEDFTRMWNRGEGQRRAAVRIDRAIRRAKTPARVYSVARHRRAIMLELAVGWAR